MIRKKILLLGDFHVGKTSLIRRYVDNAFSDDYLTTIGVKISKKQITLHDREYELLIWDIEGATPTKKIPTHYFAGAAGAIVVGDLTREETLTSLPEHLQSFHSVNRGKPWVFAYNKVDLLPVEQRKRLQLPEWSFATSAKEDLNVDTLFTTLLERIVS